MIAARQSLIDAAYPLFLRYGYDGTGLSQILRDAGLSKGGFYHHFPSKLTLLAAVTEQALPVPFGEVDWAHHATLSVAEQQQFIRAGYGEASAGFDVMQGSVMRYFSFFFDALAHLDDYRASVDATYGQMISALAAAHEREGDATPQETARAFIAAFEGEIFLRAVTTSPKEIE